MKEMLHRDMSPDKETVDSASVLDIIMQSDMAKAFPDIAAVLAGVYNEKANESRNLSNEGEIYGNRSSTSVTR